MTVAISGEELINLARVSRARARSNYRRYARREGREMRFRSDSTAIAPLVRLPNSAATAQIRALPPSRLFHRLSGLFIY